MKVFVTGATGFLGSHLAPAMRGMGWDVTSVGSAECDLTRQGSLDRFHEKYDQIWHLAAWTQAGDFCLHHPGEQWLVNQKINTHILDWWHRTQPESKLIAIGTSCSYAPGSIMVEDNYLLGEPVAELYAYGMTKRMLLVGLRALSSQYGLRYLYLVPSTLMGPHYKAHGKQLHFIFDIIRKILRGSIYGEPVVLWGDGHQKRELIFVGDFVDAALRLASSVDNEIINIGSGREYSIRWYANQISRRLEFNPDNIQYDAEKYTGVRSKQLSVEKLSSLLEDFQPTPIETALDQTIRWCVEDAKSYMETA